MPATIQVLAIPDSGYDGPLRKMLIGSTFSPGRLRGRLVRTMIELAVDLSPGTPPNPTSLVGAARLQLAAQRTDSALALLHEALDPQTDPTDGERVYALLVEGIAWSATGRDSAARAAFDTALAGYRRLEERGIDLAPFLERLADSVRSIRSARPIADAFGRPVALGSVDAAPVLLSHPPIAYPPEMPALRVGGAVTVEATVDSSGRVVPGSAKVVQSPNPGLDHEALRVVSGSRYRPARRGGHAVGAVIRQTITFKPY
jgi:TonB family protein